VVCQGTGYLKTTDSIDKCPHCDGTGEFIYDDQVRSSIMGVKKNYFMKYKKEYESIIEKINTIENSALSKIGDN
jgi:DnaJ-class molecular chaperone